uniref:FAD-binding PCMH-type domain-containing protein n=1 Tax=Arcella intermedia TaxID=1963864 RepID=A0A6B2L2Q7_9EUKA
MSPNGLSFSEPGMVSMAGMNRLLSVDVEKKQATFQAGATVSDVVKKLRPYGLTLQNFASISEQQLGGLIQVGAHGTGATIPPMEEQVVELNMVCPGTGPNVLSREKSPDLFRIVLVGLGSFGIISDVTLQCVPEHNLEEITTVHTRSEVKRNHSTWLKENRHLRYMWIPYTDKVVVVKCNPHSSEPPYTHHTYFNNKAKEDFNSTMQEVLKSKGMEPQVDLPFTQIRDDLLSPPTCQNISFVNELESRYWESIEGSRVGRSSNILGFDCGGHQLVSEVAFPCGTIDKPDGTDIEFVEQVLKVIERNKIPAPSPIEQRWTAASGALFSPAFSTDPKKIFSWVGIIMYLPAASSVEEMKQIMEQFHTYKKLCRDNIWDNYNAKEHWAKLEMPTDPQEKKRVANRIQSQYDVETWSRTLYLLDPRHKLMNEFVAFIVGKSKRR